MKKIFIIMRIWRSCEGQLESMNEGSAFLSEAEAREYCDRLNQKDLKYLWYDYREMPIKALDKIK